IFGLLTPGAPINLDACRRATSTLKHRGPDGTGFVFGRLDQPGSTQCIPSKGSWQPPHSTNGQQDWCLGHQRLAIVDLGPSASQPMSNEDGSCWVVFNGEIYNHRDLRHDLTQLG